MAVFDALRLFFILGGAIPAIAFPIYYHFTATWYTTKEGRYIMMGGLGWASLYGTGVVNLLLHSLPFQEALRVFLMLFAFVFAWVQIWTYWRLRRDEINRRKNEKNLE